LANDNAHSHAIEGYVTNVEQQIKLQVISNKLSFLTPQWVFWSKDPPHLQN